MLTRIAPSLLVANWVIAHSAQFGAQMPTPLALLDAEAHQGAGAPVDLVPELPVRVAQPLVA